MSEMETVQEILKVFATLTDEQKEIAIEAARLFAEGQEGTAHQIVAEYVKAKGAGNEQAGL